MHFYNLKFCLRNDTDQHASPAANLRDEIIGLRDPKILNITKLGNSPVSTCSDQNEDTGSYSLNEDIIGSIVQAKNISYFQNFRSRTIFVKIYNVWKTAPQVVFLLKYTSYNAAQKGNSFTQ